MCTSEYCVNSLLLCNTISKNLEVWSNTHLLCPTVCGLEAGNDLAGSSASGSHKATIRHQGCGLIWRLTWDRFDSKQHSLPHDSWPQPLACCWLKAAFSSFPFGSSQSDCLLPSKSAERESPSKIGIAFLCNIITNVTSCHLCPILWPEVSQQSPHALKVRDYTRHEYQDNDVSWGPSAPHKCIHLIHPNMRTSLPYSKHDARAPKYIIFVARLGKRTRTKVVDVIVHEEKQI